MDYKECPNCRAMTPLETQQCATCGHQFRTHFQAPSPPNQTQAFSTPPGYAAYPHYVPNHTGFLSAIPGWACFLIGFLIPIVGVIFGILCFAADNLRDPERGKLFLYGAAASFALSMLMMFAFLGLTVFIR